MGDFDCDAMLLYMRRVIQDYPNEISRQREFSDPDEGDTWKLRQSILDLRDALESCIDGLSASESTICWDNRFGDV